MELRSAGITMPLLILGHTPSEYTETLIDNDITQTVSCLAKAQEFSARAAALGRQLRIHIKIDAPQDNGSGGSWQNGTDTPTQPGAGENRRNGEDTLPGTQAEGRMRRGAERTATFRQMLENGYVHDSDGFLNDGENTSW